MHDCSYVDIAQICGLDLQMVELFALGQIVGGLVNAGRFAVTNRSTKAQEFYRLLKP